MWLVQSYTSCDVTYVYKRHYAGKNQPKVGDVSGALGGSGGALRSRQGGWVRRSIGHTIGRTRSTTTDRLTERHRNDMADLLFAVLLIGVFLTLALALRGLERL